MLFQFQEYLTFENIYIYTSFGVLPFWILLILVPNSKVTQIFVNSIILPVILSSAYIYVLYQSILLDESFFDIFKLYLNMDNLYTIFATESFLLFFWIHFLAINLFLGSWVSRDSVKYNIPRKIIFLPLILIYFTGPTGLVVYWFFRVFYSKKLGLHD
tara:strand:- start:173 stop:646 length:474 start_codon:yes stop_codon:yes gene_type:complete